MIDRGQNTNII